MTNLNQESLFSLELIVDRLCLHRSVECRIPAVAFRLLDFPTLLIYHVEPELAVTIRSKLLEDRYWPVPAQLNELKDRNTGAFLISRGKSCLFRVSPNTLVSSLSSAPLYVMVVDMFPETPKLVGSCGVTLNASARDLYNNIVTNGISVPDVQAEKKELDLCNLMGTKLGTILLGYRLLSLGSALLSHIPTHNIIHIKPKEEIDQCFCPTVDEVPQSVTEAWVTSKQSATAREQLDNFEVDKTLEKTFADSQTQIEPCSIDSVGTQTSRLRSHTDKPRTSLLNDADDIITTNIVRPPPLYYNSANCTKTVCWHQEEWSSVWQMADDGSNWSDGGTIRIEDKYLDADEEATHKMNLNHSTVKDKPSPLAQSKSAVKNDLTTKTPCHPGNMAEFPILGALMSEILQIQGMNLVPDSSAVDADHEARYRIQKMKKDTKLQKEDSRKAVKPKRCVHKCANMLPRDKGLMMSKRRSSAPAVHHQRPLFAGMTKTQKLRLAKANPKLLQEIESKEMQQRNEFRAAHMSSMRKKENVPTYRQQNADEIDTLKHIDVSRATEYADESRESTARYKCPVPTPRKSLSDLQLVGKYVPDVDTSCFGTKTYRVDRKRLQPSSSEENIQFTLPPVKGGSESDHSTCHGQSAMTNTTAHSNIAGRQVATHSKLNTSVSDDSDARPVDNFGQTASVSAPVVHRDASVVSAQLEATDAGGVLSLEDLGLRKIVDHCSDESDGDDRTVGSNDDESKDRDAEFYSVEEGEKEFDRKLSEGGGSSKEAELVHEAVNQQSDVSEDDESDLEYDYDFEDTPARSLRTVSTVNSAASSIVDVALHQRTVSPVESQQAGTDLKLSGHSYPNGRTGEQCKDYMYL